MQLIGVRKRDVILEHAGREIASPVDEWEHPELPSGERDETLLISPPIKMGEEEHRITVPLLGDHRAQRIHRAKHHGPAHETKLRERVENGGGVWHDDPAAGSPSAREVGPPPGLPVGDGGEAGGG